MRKEPWRNLRACANNGNEETEDLHTMLPCGIWIVCNSVEVNRVGVYNTNLSSTPLKSSGD